MNRKGLTLQGTVDSRIINVTRKRILAIMEDNAVFTLTLDIPGTLCRMVAPDTSHLAEGAGPDVGCCGNYLV